MYTGARSATVSVMRAGFVRMLQRVRADLGVGANLEVYALALLATCFAAYSFFNEPRVGVAFAGGAVYCCEVLRTRHREAEADALLHRLAQQVEALVERVQEPDLDHEIRRLEAHALRPGRLPDGADRPL